MRRTAGPGDLDLLGDEADAAFFLFRSGKGPVQEAERLLTKLVERLRASLGPGNAHTLGAITRLSVVLAKEKRYDEEVSLLRAAVADGKAALGSEPYIVGESLDIWNS